MRTKPLFAAVLSLGLLFAARAVAAAVVSDIELPRESPLARLSQQVGLTEIAVEYGSPAVRGRKIWGAVVPYDRVWSMGRTRRPRCASAGRWSSGKSPSRPARTRC